MDYTFDLDIGNGNIVTFTIKFTPNFKNRHLLSSSSLGQRLDQCKSVMDKESERIVLTLINSTNLNGLVNQVKDQTVKNKNSLKNSYSIQMASSLYFRKLDLSNKIFKPIKDKIESSTEEVKKLFTNSLFLEMVQGKGEFNICGEIDQNTITFNHLEGPIRGSTSHHVYFEEKWFTIEELKNRIELLKKPLPVGAAVAIPAKRKKH